MACCAVIAEPPEYLLVAIRYCSVGLQTLQGRNPARSASFAEVIKQYIFGFRFPGSAGSDTENASCLYSSEEDADVLAVAVS